MEDEVVEVPGGEEDVQCDPPPELCRACAQPSKFMIDIFSSRGIQLKLKEKIDSHLPIKVWPDDILPLQMCTNCVLRLDAFHKMTEVCSKADKKLRDTFHCPARPVSRVGFNNPSTSQADTVAQDTSMSIDSFGTYTNYDSAGNFTEADVGSKSDADTKQDTAPKKQKRTFKPHYKCPLCPEIIEGRVNFENHITCIHQKYRCDDCHKLYDSKEELFWHKDELHKNECEICDIAFGTKRAMFDHFSTLHSNLEGFECYRCDKKFPLEAMLAQHIRSHEAKYHRDVRPYKCEICNKVLRSFDSMRGHRLVHLPISEKNSYLCSLCGKGYPTACKLKYHMRFHTGEKPYKCNKCPKAFRMLGNLKLHGRVHVNGTPYKCDSCTRGFKHARDLYTHKKEYHLGTWKYKCRVCSKLYDSVEEVETHYKTHTEAETKIYMYCMEVYIKVSDHYCGKCNKYFFTSGALSAHNTRHKRRSAKMAGKSWTPTTKSDFKCEVCGKFLSSKISLSVHSRTHLKEKPFKCTMCGKGFILKILLEEHIRTHTGETPFTCEGCGKKFHRKGSLNLHYKTVHLNLRPHECDVCSKKFKTKCSLNLHYRIHTGERPYECDICHKTFVQKPDRDRHRVRHNPSDLPNDQTPADVPSTSTVDNIIQSSSKTVVNRPKKSKLSERLAKRYQKILPRVDNVIVEEQTYENVTIVQTGIEEYAICTGMPPGEGHKIVDAEVEFYVYNN